MPELSLEQRVDNLFQSALDLTSGNPDLAIVERELRQSLARLHQPMRVAIVGLIKAGKSTMMNALLGEHLVPTGNVEATFNVNVFRWGDRPSLQVHYKDERPPETKSFDELQSLTLRAAANRDYLRSIKYIEVTYPNSILHSFDLIDTPGLESHYRDDSDNTRQFLQLHGTELSEVTQAEAQGADAVMYLFGHSLAMADKEIIELFQGGEVSQATPINAIGVLTKTDLYWSDPSITEPMVAAERVCQRLAHHPQARNLFYTIYPVCAHLALGARTLTDREWDILDRLITIPPDRFERLLRNINRFNEREYPDIPILPQERRLLAERLGQYGVWQAYNLRRSGSGDRHRLITALLEHSGIDRLRDTLVSHFGHRAYLIKLIRVLRQFKTIYFQSRPKLAGKSLQVLEEIAGRFEEIETQEHRLIELNILQNFYRRKLDFDERETRDLLAVTGEFGTDCGSKLDLGERATIPEMLAVANEKLHYWQTRSADYLTIDRDTLTAAKTMARSYELIFQRLQLAKNYLYL
ncbi:dynamin family protein [Chamaesiphon polymorphus]|uniref:GTP-binding protein HSR1 n=1 Tax=Chamaesiphon polymorphus CCALA 037 TaxID=2107692 RepID=A0A2T1G3R6_9CYAN|nr:dynamin family protein [Chamaesiphon polymorphus]PSB51897.1 GTP-binding protein HSR1 [Chamaesiphon polymorphus CCALA 037]